MSSSLNNNEIKKLASQIKEILPQVPLITIETDLQVTGNISETITRLLDEILNFQPEPIEPTSSCSSSHPVSSPSVTSSSLPSSLTSSSPSSPSSLSSNCEDQPELSLNTAAKCFGKTANERIKSFKERKAALIEAARQTYIRKHHLKL